MSLKIVDDLNLDRYHLWHAVRADPLRRLGRTADAAAACQSAIAHCGNQREKGFLEKQLSEFRGN